MSISKILRSSSCFVILFTSISSFAQVQLKRADFNKENSAIYQQHYFSALAQYYVDLGENDEAYKVIGKELFKRDFTEQDVDLGIQIAKQAGDYSAVIDIALNGVKKFQPKETWLYEIGNAHYQQAHFKTSINYFEQILKENPKHLPSITRLGDIAVQNKDQVKALQYFEEAFAYYPESDRIKRSYAIALSENGKFKESIALLSELKEENPKDEVTIYYLAIVYRKSGKITEACRNMQQAFDISNKYGKTELRKWGCR